MIAKDLQHTFSNAVAEAVRRRHEYLTLEHLLWALLEDPSAREVLRNCGVDLDLLRGELEEFLEKHFESLEEGEETAPTETAAFRRVR